MAADSTKFVYVAGIDRPTTVRIPSLMMQKWFPKPPSRVVLTAVDGVPWTIFTRLDGDVISFSSWWEVFKEIYIFGASDIAEFTYDLHGGFNVCVFGNHMLPRTTAEVEENLGIIRVAPSSCAVVLADCSTIDQLLSSGIGFTISLNESPVIQLTRRRMYEEVEKNNYVRCAGYPFDHSAFLSANNVVSSYSLSEETELSSGWSSNSPSGNQIAQSIPDSAQRVTRPRGSPHCSIDVTQASLQNGFRQKIPTDFAASQLVRGANKRVLHVIGGSSCEVVCLLKAKQAHIVAGWMEFSLSNQLAPGDRCIFQQSLDRASTWNVSFYWGA